MMETNPCDILIVEDNPTDAELTLRALAHLNVANRVTVVEGGEEALDYLLGRGRHTNRPNGLTPRVVLLDLKLPKVSGLEVLAQIRGDDHTRHLPVVVVTSSREDPDVREAYRLGANSYVVKPVEFEAFAEAMSQVGMYWLLINEPPR